MNLCAKFHNSSFIGVVRIDGQKSKWPKFKFHENWPKNFLAKKYFKTNYNFKFVNSVQEMNILSLKMDLQFPFQVNREYIRKK